MNRGDVKAGGCGRRCYLGICLEGLRKPMKISVRIVIVPNEIRSKKFLNTCRKNYRLVQLVGPFHIPWFYHIRFLVRSINHEDSKWTVFISCFPSLTHPDSLLCTMFSNTLSRCERPIFTPIQNKMQNYKSLSYILILTFLDSRWYNTNVSICICLWNATVIQTCIWLISSRVLTAVLICSIMCLSPLVHKRIQAQMWSRTRCFRRS
jgi:hypothetical protein